MSSTEEEAFAVYQSVLKFNFYFRVAVHKLCCGHKLLEPFLSKGIKMPKVDQWAMELAGYNILFLHIKRSNNIIADIISRLKILDILRTQ